MGTGFKNVIETVYELGKKLDANESSLWLQILFGYASLLEMKEATLKVLMPDSESIEDLEGARKAFKEKAIQPRLIKQGLNLVISYFEPDDSANVLCNNALSKEDNNNESSFAFLKALIDALQNDFLSLFGMDSSLDAILSFTKEKNESAEVMSADNQNKDNGGLEDNTESDEEKEAEKLPVDESEEEKQPDLLELSRIYRKLRIDLLNAVKGQEDAVVEFFRGCFQGDVLSDSFYKKPKAIFLFVGPPGVGEFQLARTAAESLNIPCKIFNMGEYSSNQSYESFIGNADNNDKGVKFNREQLIDFVERHHKCILVFDEIEKANTYTLQIVLQILDLGVLENQHNETKTDFSNTIIIFTSNSCGSIYEKNYGNVTKTAKETILAALQNEKNPNTDKPVFPIEICSRIPMENIIMFRHLGTEQIAEIVKEKFEITTDQIKDQHSLITTLDPKLPLLFLFNKGGRIDPRIAMSQSRDFIKNELFEIAFQIESHEDLVDNAEAIKFEIDIDSCDIEIKELFENESVVEIGILCEEDSRKAFSLPKNYSVKFFDNAEDLVEYTKLNPTMIIIDLTFGISEKGQRGVSIDDLDSVGVKAFDMVAELQEDTCLYVLESGDSLTETDRMLYYKKGASGFIKSDVSESMNREITEIADSINLEKKVDMLSKSGYYIDYNTSQERIGSTLTVRFHSLAKKRNKDFFNDVNFLSDDERPSERFSDVIGAKNAKEELKYFIKYLSNPRKFIRNGGKPAKGVLLYGPPGTGKTMLARAMAGESDVSFIQTSATEFLDKWLGQSEQNVRNLFAKAKAKAPAIIFVDEIDAIGKTRNGQNPHVESVLNAFLTEFDGFRVDINHPVFVLAATNYSLEGSATSLDPALVRRFDNRILVDLPDESEREDFLHRVLPKKGFVDTSEDVIHNIAARTPGTSIAIIQNVVDLAYRNAHKESRKPNGNDLLNALEEFLHGEKHDFGEDYYKSVAIHESGHAYVAWISGEKPSYITIESRGNFGGYMQHENTENKGQFNKEELLARIRSALAGRAAEEVFFGKEASVNTGASSDLQNATNVALSMLCYYGMDETRMISVSFEKISNTALGNEYLEKADKIINEEMKKTVEIIREGKDMVQKLADELLKKNHLTGEEIAAVFGK